MRIGIRVPSSQITYHWYNLRAKENSLVCNNYMLWLHYSMLIHVSYTHFISRLFHDTF